MNSAPAHPLIRSYLSSVERSAAALPAPRRKELLAGLLEHMEVSLAESGAGDDAQVRDLLERLGTPQEVVRAALEEEPVTQAEGKGRTVVTLGLALLPVPLYFVPEAGIPLALVAAAAAVTRLWRSTPWTPSEKRSGTALILTPALVLPVALLSLWLFLGRVSPFNTLLAAETALILPAVGAARLAWSAARLRQNFP